MKLKKILPAILLSASALSPSFASAKSAIQVNRIEPAFWFSGMKETQLQLMIYGPQIRDVGFVLGDYPGVTLQKVIQLESPNYLLVYLNVSQDAQPGVMKFTFTNQKGKKTMVDYELKAREKAGSERLGFDASDVLYMLMPDRFAQGRDIQHPLPGLNAYTINREQPSLRHGGDLEGIRQHLDYFNQLGVTALWFTPVLENNSPDHGHASTYHGYATTDYYKIDPRFGTNEEYRQLIDECHQHGLKVVMDMIFNHCGFEHPWISDLPAKDWLNNPEWLFAPKDQGPAKVKGQTTTYRGKMNKLYRPTSYRLTPVLDPYASDVDLAETVDGWFVPSMPDLNQRNPHVIRYLIQNSKWWIETAGIDGIRMDTYPYADRQAMADWMRELLAEYPHFNVVGETWVNEPAYTAAWQKDSPNATVNSYLPTVMDFSFWDKVNGIAGKDNDGLERIYNNFVYDYLYVDPLHVMAFLENHDTDRFLREGQDAQRLKLAMTLLLTTRRIPQLYYGTEVLLNGTKAKTDGYVRKDFPGGWADDTHNAFTSEGRTAAEEDMFQWTSKVLHWRRGCEAVTKGSMIHFYPTNGCYVYARSYAGKTVLVILNGSNKEQTLPLERYQQVIGTALQGRDVTTQKVVSLQQPLTLAAREALILEL